MDEKPLKQPLRIVFMGTPDFAVPALEALHEIGHDVLAAVTRPDRPKGRGRRLFPPPVKTAAVALGIDVFQPQSMRSEETADRLASLAADLFVVVAYGQILPRRILDIPKLGAINVHASLLPKYRGSAPIQWAIINQEAETGVTTIFMDAGMDTGAILMSESLPLGSEETAATLHDRLSETGARLLVKTVERAAAGTLQPVPQNGELATYAPMLKKADGRIDWHKPAAAIEAFIRGVTPWPGAFTFHGKRRLKIFKAGSIASRSDEAPGTVVKGFSGELRIAAGDGVLNVLEIQSASGKRLPTGEFLRGHPMVPGDVVA
jgi:methionyl-tRNA formyltransferase